MIEYFVSYGGDSMSGFKSLIDNATIQIHEYGIDRQTYMNHTNRIFPFYVMSYISEGSALLRIGNKEYEHLPNKVILVPPYTRHDHVMPQGSNTLFWWWHFDYKVYDTIDLLKLIRLPMIFTLKHGKQFEAVFSEYNKTMDLPSSLCNTLRRKASSMNVLAHLLGEAEEENLTHNINSEIPNVFREILDVIVSGDVNNLNLQYFADKYGMHPTYISNRFSEYFGIPPIRLYRKLQLERAAKALSSGKSVSEVAEIFGFSDVSVFSRLFTSAMGISPSKYARENPPKHISGII